MLTAPVVVLDFETTGLSPGSDRITEVAALRVVGTRVVDRYVTLVNAGVRIPAHITSLTGITNDMIATAPRATDVVRALADFIATDLVVAHNASFDRGFLEAECVKAHIFNRSFDTLCTMRLARRLMPGFRSYKLSSVATCLGVSRSGSAHRAESDARVTAEVLVALTRKVAVDHGATAIDPYLLRRVTGWTTREVPTKLKRALSPAAPARARKIPSTDQDEVRRSGRSGSARDRQGADPGDESSPWPNRFPTPVPWTSRPGSADNSSPSRTSQSRAAPSHAHDTVRSAGLRWWLDRDGDLHDRDHGCIHLKSRGAIRLVEHPQPGVIIQDPAVGELFVPGAAIEGFAAATRFVASMERDRASWIPRSSGLNREAPKPWVLDLETNTLLHRASGRAFKPGEYTRVTGAVSGYSTRDPLHPWASDIEIDIEWGA